MQNFTMRAKIQYEESLAQLKNLNNQIPTDDIDHLPFFKEQYFPQAIETYTHELIWQFEIDFPIGGRLKTDAYIQSAFETQFVFF